MDENVVTLIRDQERLLDLRNTTEKYRDLIDSFDFPNKIKTMLLKNSNKHKIKNLKNFEYSLGQPKKVVFEKTPINIYGHRGDLVYTQTQNSFGVKASFYKFQSFDNRLKMVFPQFKNSFYIC